MDVQVQFKPGQRWLRSAKKPSVLGGGLLERMRSTTLALLGVTTAVGLAMVALALNQSWPLVAGSPIPGVTPRHAAVGKATVAAQATANTPGSGLAGSAGTPSRRSRAAARGGAQAPEHGPTPSASAELVVAPASPAGARGDAPATTGKPTTTRPPAEKTPQAPAAGVPQPAQPEPATHSPPPVETTPPATSSEAPADSSPPPWSNGKGHAYGRHKSATDGYGRSDGYYDDDRDDDDDDWDDEDGHDHHHHDD